MFYCEKCRLVFEEDACRRCGKKLRPVQGGDFCFLRELASLDAQMLANVFEGEKILFARLPKREVFGYGSLTRSPQKEQIFVAFAHLERAKEILQEQEK